MTEPTDLRAKAGFVSQVFGKPGDINARMTVGDLDVHFSEKQGLRDSQEDQFWRLSNLNMGSQRKREQFVKDAFREVAGVTDKQDSGCTCTLALVSREREITVGHLGDSPAVLFMRDRATGKVTYKELTQDHTPGDPKERARIIRSGGEVSEDGRIIGRGGRGRLAVARGFGDGHYPGVGRTPDVNTYKLDDVASAADTDFYLLVSCDGMLERSAELTKEQRARVDEINSWPEDREITQEEFYEIQDLKVALQAVPPRSTVLQGIADVIAEHGDDPEENVARLLVAKALLGGSHDNVTGMFSKIPDHMKKDTALLIADGHGGKECAQQVAGEFALRMEKFQDVADSARLVTHYRHEGLDRNGKKLGRC